MSTVSLKTTQITRLDLFAEVGHPDTQALKTTGVKRITIMTMGYHRGRLTATLKTDNIPVSGRTINFAYRPRGVIRWTPLGTALTNVEGKAYKDYILPGDTYYDFKAWFEGDETFKPSSAMVENFFAETNTPYHYETLALKTIQGVE